MKKVILFSANRQLESQAIRYELMGDFWNARKTWYAIKQIDPLFPRVDIKIRELEREVAEMAWREKAERESAEKASYQKIERQVSARDAIKKLFSKTIPSLRIIGVMGIIVALFWVGSWAVSKFIALVPTQQATATRSPIAKVTSTNPSVSYTKTSIPSFTPTFTALQPTKTPTRSSTPTVSSTPSVFGNWIFYKDWQCDGEGIDSQTLKINPDKTLEMSWQSGYYTRDYITILNLDEQWVRWMLGNVKFDGKWGGEKMSGSYIGGIGGTAGCWTAQKQ